MFKKTTHEKTGLETVIDELLNDMSFVSKETDEYSKMVDQLVKLYSLKETDSKRRISPDTLATVTANLAGIILIVGHERAHVVTSKALGFVLKLR